MRMEIAGCTARSGDDGLRHHDQVEAMTLADRIVVLKAGRRSTNGCAPRGLSQPATTCRCGLHRRRLG
ncbi:hypothetical protein F2981_20740 (plasmid) [Sinorhizobium meliloti]|nr:hypothetical protein [Sinorhizobium meliloti]